MNRSYPFVRDIYMNKEVSPPLYQEKEDASKSLEALINREGTALSLHNSLSFVYCDFPGHLA